MEPIPTQKTKSKMVKTDAPLRKAAMAGSLKKVTALVAAGADVNECGSCWRMGLRHRGLRLCKITHGEDILKRCAA